MSENVKDIEEMSAKAAPVQNGRLGRRLLALLKKELLLQHRLLAVTTQMREAIVERDVAALETLRERHVTLLDEAEQVAGERMNVSWDIARTAGNPPAVLTLSQVADCCPGEVALLIGAASTLLVEIASQVHESNQLNRQLLENELDYIGASLEVLARAAAPRKDYSAPLESAGAFAIILDKAA